MMSNNNNTKYTRNKNRNVFIESIVRSSKDLLKKFEIDFIPNLFVSIDITKCLMQMLIPL